MSIGIPIVIKTRKGGERAYDIYSRLLEERIIFLNDEVNRDTSNVIIAQMLYLDSEKNEDISFYINSPGGSVTAGLAIHDTMKYIKSDVSTICVGEASSMGALLLSSGAKGKRFSLPNSRIMIHQVLGGTQGQATDIEIQTREILRLKNITNTILSNNTGNDINDIIAKTDRDNFMSPEEAKAYGIIDEIISKVPDNA